MRRCRRGQGTDTPRLEPQDSNFYHQGHVFGRIKTQNTCGSFAFKDSDMQQTWQTCIVLLFG